MTDKQLQQQILDTSAIEKILKVAETSTGTIEFPHLTTFGCTEYKYEPLTWWTSGFFPGSLWVILERYHKSKQLVDGVSIERIEKLANEWKDKLKGAEYNTNTHDIGFLIMPAYQRHYELTGDKASAKAIVQAAESLLTRWNEKVQCLRSWNKTQCKNYQFMSQDRDFLVIIDNMMNLDLLYSASLISGDPKYADIATRHSETTLKNHVRSDWSTYHLIVYDPVTGEKKIGLTHQGYDHESTWSRGQAWALYGFATVYKYTKQTKFLDAAKNLADHFISRLEDGVVYWDFDAPRPCVWDTSAATIACSGMLLICQLAGPDKKYLDAVNSMLKKCVDGAIAPPNTVTILDHATTNNYRYSLKPFADHGLVYADYYFLEAGNRLIDLNLV